MAIRGSEYLVSSHNSRLQWASSRSASSGMSGVVPFGSSGARSSTTTTAWVCRSWGAMPGVLLGRPAGRPPRAVLRSPSVQGGEGGCEVCLLIFNIPGELGVWVGLASTVLLFQASFGGSDCLKIFIKLDPLKQIIHTFKVVGSVRRCRL